MNFDKFSFFFLVLFYLLVAIVEGDFETSISSLRRVKRQRPKSCSKNQYKCSNGQCIAASVICNGIKNCLDGTDEAWEACQTKYPNACILPPNSEDKNLTINCDSSTSIKIFPSTKGDFVQELTLISFDCNSQYTATGHQFQSVCLEGKWTPQFPHCIKTCDALQIFNVDVQCYMNEQQTDCKKQHLSGTVIRPQCSSNFNPNVEEAICDTNGRWNVDRVECLGCGTVGLKKNPPFQYPWTVAIYLKQFSVLVCAGTILSPNIVVTAASCFGKEKANQPNDYIVVMGKRKRKYREKDSQFQRDYRIQKIYIHENFQDDTSSNDIAILELTEKIIYNSEVYPVCVDWNRKQFNKPKDDSLGYVANYIVNDATGTANSNLYIPSEMEIFFQSNVPLVYISRDTCVNSVAARMKGFINIDKFCAKRQNNQPILLIDKGTGFVVEINNKYYLEGIVSGMFSPVNTFRVFTDISQHTSWITPFLNSTKKTQKPKVAVTGKVPELTFKDEIFSFDSLRINCTAGDIYTEFLEGCTLPYKNLYNIDYDVTCPENIFQSYCNQATEGAPIPEYTSLRYKCRNGFHSYMLEKSAASVCFQGRWTPPIVQCSRVCKKLKPENVILQCTYEGRKIDCNNELIVNTELTPVSCQPEYKKNITTDSGIIYCRENGQWSGSLLQCVPICGHSSKTKVTPTIHGGDPVLLGEFPWHAAVYEKTRNNTLICGATIISPYALLSAAHCFFDRNNNRYRDAKDYEIGVSKVSQNRFKIDSETTRFYEIESLIFNNFGSLQLRFQRDIVIVITKNKISFSPQVSPICLFQEPAVKISKGAMLDIPGWGIDETGNPNGSPNLKIAHLPYFSFEDCAKIATESIIGYLSTEKFCAGHFNVSTLDQGDSGGGLVLRNSIDSYYYLVGIVSIRVSDGSYISLSTYVPEYLPWINKNLNEIERNKSEISEL